MPTSRLFQASYVPYDASNVGVELWNSEQDWSRDSVGSFAKFCPPTIADGKVFLATFSNELLVYGRFAPGIISQPTGALILSGQAVTLAVAATGLPPLSYQWYQGTSGDTSQPVGDEQSEPDHAAPFRQHLVLGAGKQSVGPYG